MKNLCIDEAKRRMKYIANNFTGYKLTQGGNSVIQPEEAINIEVYGVPTINLNKLPSGLKMATCVMNCVVLENVGKDWYKDTEYIRLIITKKDFTYLTEKLKVQKGDRVLITSKEILNKFKNTKFLSNSFMLPNKAPSEKDIVYDDPNTELVSNKKEKITL